MALDWGEKRIGWAISDPSATLVGKRGIYQREKEGKDLEFFKRLALKNEVSKLVIGLPRNMDGSLGKQAQRVVKFKEKLDEKLTLQVNLFDERLTTQEAERILLKGDMRRAKRKKVIDGISASLILQAYLESKRSKNSS